MKNDSQLQADVLDELQADVFARGDGYRSGGARRRRVTCQ
jgi:hypothetical protein